MILIIMINGKTLISILNKIILLFQSIGILILSLLKIIRLKYYILSEIGNTGTKDKLDNFFLKLYSRVKQKTNHV